MIQQLLRQLNKSLTHLFCLDNIKLNREKSVGLGSLISSWVTESRDH